MHCGSVRIWDGQPCDCNCEACWFRDVNVFTRFVCDWTEYPGYEFNVGSGGELVVAETMSNPLSMGEMVNEVPVFPVHEMI